MSDPPRPLQQAALFELPEPTTLSPPPRALEHAGLAAEIPESLRFGGMSWTYPGWRGLVYDGRLSADAITEHGLTAYAKHPLFRAVEIDRSYYEPLPTDVLARYASMVPADHRFVVKAHEASTVARFPMHARYGKLRGERSAQFLDASYVEDAILRPCVEGLGDKLSLVLFQFPPQEVTRDDAHRFAATLRRFLERVARVAPCAVELRTPDLFTSSYREALLATGAVHCHNAWSAMPDVVAQAKLVPPAARSPLLVRWLLRRGATYEREGERFKPFHRIVEEDPPARDAIARLVTAAAVHEVPTLALVANHAEGCAPDSIAWLARTVVDRLAARR